MNSAQQTEMLELYNRSIHDGVDLFEKLLVHQKTTRKASPKDRSQQEARRARARENALMQLYNKGRPKDLGWSMNSLRRSLQLCSIENTGWAAKEDILNVLTGAGVSKRDSDVLLSTSQDQKSSIWFMYWPEVIRFLEEGPTTQPNKSLIAKAPSTAELDEASRGRESYERVEKDTLKNPANSKLDNTCNNIPSEVKSSQNNQSPALDHEHVTLRHDSIDFTSERRGNKGSILEQSAVSNSRDQLEQSLLELENSVRMTEFGEGPVVPYQRLTEIIKKVRAVLRVAAVDDDIPGPPGNGKNATTTTTKTTVRSGGRSMEDDGPKRLTSIEVDSPKGSPVGSTLAVDDKSTSLKDIKEAESLAAEACAAGKKGDIGALENLSRVVDLRRTDAFGRNALYYACLCGHVDAVQYVADGTYGGVQGIPNDERWECSKSALTEEIRRYLNGRYVARNTLEGPSTTRTGADSSCTVKETATAIQESDTKKSVELGQPPLTPKEVVSIASLFEWGGDSDY